jgi:hypothetical protein
MRCVSNEHFCVSASAILVLLIYSPMALGQVTMHVPTIASAPTALPRIAPKAPAAVGAAGLSVTTTIPSGIVGTAYSQTLTAAGGAGGDTWSITSGLASLTTLGLNMSASGVISGTPSVAGTASFTAQVKDASGSTATAAYALTIDAGKTEKMGWLPTVGLDSTTEEKFFGVNGAVSPLTQIGSAYNGASSSATVSANLVSLIMPGGWQAVASTNVQAGSSGETSVAQGTIPTLAATAAGQATQNMLYGGTIAIAADLPIFYYGPNMANPGGIGIELDAVGREGIDVQNFKAGTSTSVSSPPSHFASQLEGYFLMNSWNSPSPGASGFAGSLFIGGSYGYSYTSHGYARDYGFGNRVNNDIGQVTAGIMITNVSKISVSRAFGPSQNYIDSTSMAQTKINNFKAWSFAITYQSVKTTN